MAAYLYPDRLPSTVARAPRHRCGCLRSSPSRRC